MVRLRALALAMLGFASLFGQDGSEVRADVVTLPDQSIPVTTQTNWDPTTQVIQGLNPLTFDQFNPALGTLTAVNLKINYATTNVASMTFGTGGTEFVSTQLPGTNHGTTIELRRPTNDPANPIDSQAAPAFTYTRTYGTNPGETFPRTFSSDPKVVAPGSANFLTPDGDPTNTTSSFAKTVLKSLTSPSDLAFFIGSGKVGLPAFSTGHSDFSSSSANGGGVVQTYAGIDVGLSYVFTPLSPVPEPASLLLLGAGGCVLAAGGLGRRRTVVAARG